MQGAEMIADSLGRIAGSLERGLQGISRETLHRIPSNATNSIAWLAWHLTRVQDDHVMQLAGRPVAWVEESWHELFGMSAENDFGFGWAPSRAAEFNADSCKLLLDYHQAVLERSLAYLGTVLPEDLDRVLDEPQWNPRPTVGVRLVSLVNDNTQHVGQIMYLRGLFDGFGWQQ